MPERAGAINQNAVHEAYKSVQRTARRVADIASNVLPIDIVANTSSLSPQLTYALLHTKVRSLPENKVYLQAVNPMAHQRRFRLNQPQTTKNKGEGPQGEKVSRGRKRKLGEAAKSKAQTFIYKDDADLQRQIAELKVSLGTPANIEEAYYFSRLLQESFYQSTRAHRVEKAAEGRLVRLRLAKHLIGATALLALATVVSTTSVAYLSANSSKKSSNPDSGLVCTTPITGTPTPNQPTPSPTPTCTVEPLQQIEQEQLAKAQQGDILLYDTWTTQGGFAKMGSTRSGNDAIIIDQLPPGEFYSPVNGTVEGVVPVYIGGGLQVAWKIIINVDGTETELDIYVVYSPYVTSPKVKAGDHITDGSDLASLPGYKQALGLGFSDPGNVVLAATRKGSKSNPAIEVLTTAPDGKPLCPPTKPTPYTDLLTNALDGGGLSPKKYPRYVEAANQKARRSVIN